MRRLCSYLAIIRSSGDEVRGDPLDTGLLEGESAGFERLILDRDAGMLAHMFRPRGDEESFQVALGIGQVAEESPADGTLPPAKDAHLVHSLNELARVLYRYAVFDRDEYGSIVRVGCKRQLRIRPVPRGRHVELLNPMQRPAQCCGQPAD